MEVVYIIIYLLNKYTTKVVRWIILEKAWTGYKSSSKHLKVFGYITYTYVLEKKNDKIK